MAASFTRLQGDCDNMLPAGRLPPCARSVIWCGRKGLTLLENGRLRLTLLFPAMIAASPALAEAAPAAASAQELSQGSRDGEIVVIAERTRGQIETDAAPVMTLDENEVASYGAGSLAELVAAISPQTGSGRGRGGGHPVMLMNGQRVSNFREMRNFPPEAIRKVEVLPEEVALKFGYPPDQRVINFILKDNFASRNVAGEVNLPTLGGFANSEIEAGLLRIDGPSRLNLQAKITDDSLLTEAERKVIQPTGSVSAVASDRDPATARSLVDDSREAVLNATWSTGLGERGMDGSLSVNGSVTRADSRALWGLDTVTLIPPGGAGVVRTLGDPLTRVSRSTTLEAGVTFNRRLGDWQLSATADASHNDTRTRVDRQADLSALVAAVSAGALDPRGALPAPPPPGFDRSRTRDLALKSLATLSGRPFAMPAGDASLTLRAGFDFSRSRNFDTRGGGGTDVLRRGDLSGGFNLGLPLTSRRNGVLGGLGDVSLSLGAGVNHLSDFGTLKDWNAGLTWNPTERLSLQASWIVNEAAPSLNDLGNPQLAVFNVAVYDYTRGETALVTVINGGNPDLKKERQRDLKLSATWELPFLERSNLIAEYFRNRSDDVTRSFPLLTPPIEAAFPGRAVRDASGRLVSIDRRPVTYDRVSSSRIRWGLNLSGQLGKEPERGPGAGGPRAGGNRARGPMMGGPPGGGRWNLSLYHTYRISEDVRIGPAGPLLDLLDGDAITTGGVARHSFELEGGLFRNGKGLRFNGSWMAPVTIRATGAPGSADLRFGSVLKLDVRAFVDFDRQGDLTTRVPLLKGVRLALDVQNLLNSRQKVTDPAGLTPLSYQKDYRDPRGRMVGIDLRKMF